MSHELIKEKEYFQKVLEVIFQKIKKLESEYSRISPYVYAVGDLFNDWEYETKKLEALRIKREYEPKLNNLKRLQKEPYFGKIHLVIHTEKKEYYIGQDDIIDTHNKQHVISWRTELGDLFYKRLPSVKLKNGTIVIINKTRSFTIKNGSLESYKDFEIIREDNHSSDLLTAYKQYISSDFLQNQLVNRNAQMLRPILQTIDQKQNEIIRMSMNRPIVVQGVSGSGKTTMGLQRLSYIMYHFEKKYNKSASILAICPNDIFLDYINELVPNLSLQSVKFMTIQQLFNKLLPKGIRFAKIKIKNDLTYHFNHTLEKEKKSLYVEWFQLKGAKIYAERLKEHIDNMKKEAFFGDYTSIHPLLNNKIINQIYDRVKDLAYNDMYNRTIIFIQQLFDLKTPENSTELVSNFKKYWNVKRKSVDEVYKEFLQKEYLFSADRNNLLVQLNRNQREYYEEDIPALVYTSFLLDKPNNIQNYDHIFIDEAQDINYIQFLLLKSFCPTSSFTIVGDLNQQIYLQRGIGSWENLKPLFHFNFMSLEYNYRSSKEIMDLATSCLIQTEYKGTGILETGVRPVQYFFNKKTSGTENWLRIKNRYLENWLLSKQSIAIITNSIEDSEKIEENLHSIGLLETNVIRSSKSTLEHSKITIISSLQVKGLEFNHVLLYNPSEKEYPADNYFSKLLYMAMTRALYNLVLLIIDNPSLLLEEADLNYLCQNIKE